MTNTGQKEDAARRKLLARLFEGSAGRLPKTDDELIAWLASPEGKAAATFEPTSAERWGEIGRA